MAENLGPQYALEVAVQTMKERCLQLEQRLSIVEEENMNLRVKHHIDGLEVNHMSSSSEIDILHKKIAQLSKVKSQLTHNVLMVATENRHLWSRLSKLTQDNQTLGNQLVKINNTLNQNTPTSSTIQTTLIRSKTFTHESPPKIVKKTEDNAYTDASLEDISLKIINSIAQEKYELEKQCAQMTEMQSTGSMITNSIGFAYPYEEFDECAINEISQNMEKMILVKDSLITQREQLKNGFEMLRTIIKGGVLCKSCEENNKKNCEEAEVSRPNRPDNINIANESSSKPVRIQENEKICPVCNKVFIQENISELVRHVETHFTGEEDLYYELVPEIPGHTK